MNKFGKRVYYRLEMLLVSPLSIGSGESESTDHDIIIDAVGRPFIPATAIAGVLRHSFPEDTAKRIFGYIPTSKEEKAADPPVYPGRIMLYDALMTGKNEQFFITNRDSVKLEEKVDVKGAKFDMQAVEPGVKFVSYIELLDESFAKDIENTFAKVNAGFIRFGTKTTRGYGQVKLSVKKKEIPDFDAYSDFAVYNEKKWACVEVFTLPEIVNDNIKIVLSLQSKGGISIREYSTDVGRPDFETISVHNASGVKDTPVIPGTSWAGAMRSRFFELTGNDEELINALFGYVNEKEKDKAIKSKIYFSETQLSGGTYKESTRNSIDRFSAATKDGALYTERTYFYGKTELEIVITKKLCDKEKFALAATIADLHNGFLAVGGLTAVGRGLFEVTAVNGSTETAKLLDMDTLDLDKFIREVFGK